MAALSNSRVFTIADSDADYPIFSPFVNNAPVSGLRVIPSWLRKKGITDGKPIHALRKEYGSVVNQKYDIFVASRALRHASVAITDQYYVDARGARPTVGLGYLLTGGKKTGARPRS
jgi:integrase